VVTKKSNKPTPAKRLEKKQNELIIVMILSLILGLGGGYLIGAGITEKASETTVTEKASKQMQHPKFEVPADQAPTVELIVEEDAKSGYNIKIITTNFTFTPEKANEENVIGEGHAHLYVGSEKIGRVYGNYYHYNGNFEGTKTFRVTLNGNDHSDYVVNGEVIGSSVEITHDGSDPNHKDFHMDKDKMQSENM